MFSFFKKKVSTEEIGAQLLGFAKDTNQDLLKSFSADLEVERQLVQDEMFYLQACTVGIATFVTIGNNSKGDAILKTYHAHLQKLLNENVSDNISFEEFKNRLLDYKEALKTPHHNGLPWTVGKTFSKLCGREMELYLTTTGSILFSTTLDAVSKFLESFKIIE